ncbi:hypothetical protein [Nocardioides sp. LML1-1-1.1]|uniref:hypothetical protein n=1 Tax=Nocardioides sp. LML1-1-1.1 TaxID=3135248 RepID=UPI00343170BC
MAHPTGHTDAALLMVMFGGPILYLGTQAWYLKAVTGTGARAGLLGLVSLAAGACLGIVVNPVIAFAILCAILVVYTSSTGQPASAQR